MICDICKKNTAIIHIQEIGPNGKHTLNLCSKCAITRFFGENGASPRLDQLLKELSQSLSNPEALSAIMSQFGKHKGLFQALDDHSSQTQCPRCGRTWEDIKRTRQIGCEACFETFHDKMAGVLETINNVIWNNYEKNVRQDDINLEDEEEKDIEKSVSQRDLQFEIERLNRELACAVKEENYERAARLRDLIAEFNPVNSPEQSE